MSTTIKPRRIITADESRIAYAISLADKHKAELGFLPRSVYAPLAAANRLKIATDNDDPCGFAIHGPTKKTLRIYQTCVQLDARRFWNGSELINQIIAQAIVADVHQITLHCAADLEANQFWQQLGFTQHSTRIKAKKTGRLQIRYWYDLPAGIIHREALDQSKLEQSRDKIMQLLGTWAPNAAAVGRDRERRRE